MRLKDNQKIENIYKATLRIIENFGFGGITMAKIASEAKLATGTLYIYFKNKEELIHALYDSLKNRSSERFVADYDKSKPFVVCLKKIWVNYLLHRIKYHDESVFLEQYYRSVYITKKQKEQAELMKQPVFELIERGKKEMLLKSNMDKQMMFSAMIGFIRELADAHFEGRYDMTQERIEKAFQLSWDSIKA